MKYSRMTFFLSSIILCVIFWCLNYGPLLTVPPVGHCCCKHLSFRSVITDMTFLKATNAHTPIYLFVFLITKPGSWKLNEVCDRNVSLYETSFFYYPFLRHLNYRPFLTVSVAIFCFMFKIAITDLTFSKIDKHLCIRQFICLGTLSKIKQEPPYSQQIFMSVRTCTLPCYRCYYL